MANPSKARGQAFPDRLKGMFVFHRGIAFYFSILCVFLGSIFEAPPNAALVPETSLASLPSSSPSISILAFRYKVSYSPRNLYKRFRFFRNFHIRRPNPQSLRSKGWTFLIKFWEYR